MKKKISWIGTSISKALYKPKVEKDLGVEVKVTRAYCIKEEEDARYKSTNFKAVVPTIMEKESPDILVLQTGSIEITNINVNGALMDVSKDIKQYKNEWFNKVEEDSKEVLHIAQNALENNRSLEKVIILKRLPRYDKSTSDLIGIKSELSKYGNAVYDLELTKMGNPENIIVLDLDLDGSGHFRNIVFGKQEQPNYDGIHCRGRSAESQFTYRVIKALKTRVLNPVVPMRRTNGRHFNYNHAQRKMTNQSVNSAHGDRSYSGAVKGTNGNTENNTYSGYQYSNQENC